MTEWIVMAIICVVLIELWFRVRDEADDVDRVHHRLAEKVAADKRSAQDVNRRMNQQAVGLDAVVERLEKLERGARPAKPKKIAKAKP